MNHYLKFQDEQTAIDLMPQFRREDGWDRCCVDPVGTLHAETGEVAEVEGQEVRLTAAIDGWHCNLICDPLPENLVEFEVFPKNPKRVWA